MILITIGVGTILLAVLTLASACAMAGQTNDRMDTMPQAPESQINAKGKPSFTNGTEDDEASMDLWQQGW